MVVPPCIVLGARNGREQRSNHGRVWMRKSALLAVACGLAMPTYGHAEEIILRF